MGGRIDRMALMALETTALYIFFITAWGSVPAACVSAFATMALLRALLKRPAQVRRRCTPLQAEATLRKLALLDEEEAKDIIEPMLRRKYPQARFEVVPLLRLPDGRVTRGDVLERWKRHRGAQTILLAATCDADPRALPFARELSRPTVAVADRRLLMRLLKEYGPPEGTELPDPPAFRARLKSAWNSAAALRVSPKAALYGLSLLGMYIVLGGPLYLVSALTLFAVFGVSMVNGRIRREPFLEGDD